jgi:4'-phosphopantetheinyl transferase
MKIGVPTVDSHWFAPPQHLTLHSGVVHIWRANLDEGLPLVNQFERTLGVDEILKADRFYFRRDRDRFIVAHGILRDILGRYLRIPPESLAFVYSFFGKPSLLLKSGVEPIRFNTSHSHGIALYAITLDRDIGIDLELVRDGLAIGEIATRFFSNQEVSGLFSLPAELRTQGFFACWTRKEAYIKARGEGLSLPLNQFDVSMIPGEPAELLGTRPDSECARRWSLHELTVASDYVAAFVLEGRACSLSCWQW